MFLSDAVDASHPLLKADGIPGQVVVDHQVAELQVDSLAGRLGGDAHLSLLVEPLLDPLAVGRWQAPWIVQVEYPQARRLRSEVVERVSVLGEDQELRAAVAHLRELRLLQAVAESD